jgi:hypothetical protein
VKKGGKPFYIMAVFWCLFGVAALGGGERYIADADVSLLGLVFLLVRASPVYYGLGVLIVLVELLLAYKWNCKGKDAVVLTWQSALIGMKVFYLAVIPVAPMQDEADGFRMMYVAPWFALLCVIAVVMLLIVWTYRKCRISGGTGQALGYCALSLMLLAANIVFLYTELCAGYFVVFILPAFYLVNLQRRTDGCSVVDKAQDEQTDKGFERFLLVNVGLWFATSVVTLILFHAWSIPYSGVNWVRSVLYLLAFIICTFLPIYQVRYVLLWMQKKKGRPMYHIWGIGILIMIILAYPPLSLLRVRIIDVISSSNIEKVSATLFPAFPSLMAELFLSLCLYKTAMDGLEKGILR